MVNHQTHKRIHEATMAHNPINEPLFTQSRHNSTWLSEKIVSFAQRRGDKLTHIQQKALIWFRTESIFNLGPADEHRKDEDVMGAYKTLFDRLFFFGSLRPHVKCVMQKPKGAEEHLMGRTDQDKSYQLKWSYPFHEKRMEACITLFRTKTKNRPERFKEYLATMLHEMIHAFLDIWGCRSEGCYNVWQRQGVKGHGHAWQDAALAIELAVADKSMLGIDLDLGRQKSLAVDIVYERRSVPEEEELRRWGMNQGEVDKIGKIVKDQHIITQVMGSR